MSQSKRALPILAVGVLALGLIVVPATASSGAPVATTTVTVQLTNLKHAALTSVDGVESIFLSGSDDAYVTYASAAAISGETAEYAGKIVKGKAVFSDVPENGTYFVDAVGSRDYSIGSKSFSVAAVPLTESLALTK